MEFDLLDKDALPSKDPLHLFNILLSRIKDRCQSGANYCTLSTVDPDTNRPSSRMVALAECSERGFRFFTQTSTEKVRHLEKNPAAAMAFWWPYEPPRADGFIKGLAVRVEGMVRRLEDEAARKQYEQWPSDEHRVTLLAFEKQGQPIEGRLDPKKVYEDRRKAVKERGAEVLKQCPKYFIGYELVPDMIEFNQPDPLFATRRLRFRRKAPEDGDWVMEYLTP